MYTYEVIPWRQKYLNVIWEAGLPSDFFRNKSQLTQLVRSYRNHFHAEVYIVSKNQKHIALLFVESVFLDKKTLVGNLLQFKNFSLNTEKDTQKILLEIGAAFYRLESNFEQLLLRIPDRTQKVIPGNEPGMFFGNSVYPNKIETRQFAAADFNPENFILFHFKKHHIAVKVVNDSIQEVRFIKPDQPIEDDALRKALLRGCFLNDSGVLETSREIIRIHSMLNPVDPQLEVKIIQQFSEYFSGQRYTFDLPYHIVQGTDFQQQVWHILEKIPYGNLISYEEVALRMTGDNAKARDLSRAIGSACGKNPLGILIPCHRVIGKDRSLTGFAGGIALKSALLDLEFINNANRSSS